MYPLRKAILFVALSISSFSAVSISRTLPKTTSNAEFYQQDPRGEQLSQLASQIPSRLFSAKPVDRLYAESPLAERSPSLPLPVESSSPSNGLIDRKLDHLIYVGVFALAIASILTIGVINQRIEHAIIFAAIVSTILIVILWFV